MRQLTLENIALACGGKLYLPKDYKEDGKEAEGIYIDSRLVGKGDIFIATKGERVDGHSFIDAVFEKGALGVICQDMPENPKGPCIQVEDSFKALTAIATYYRECLGDKIKIIGITGSVGKTSTKEFIATVLEEKYSVLKTQGNYNNEIGVPLTILRIRDEHQIAVVEMGINHFGEMSRLTHVVKPNLVVMTNIGDCHLENLGDRDGVLKAKSEIFECLDKDGQVFINKDDDKLKALDTVNGKKTISYGIWNKEADYRADEIEADSLEGSKAKILYDNKAIPVCVHIPGEHMLLKAVVATAIGKYFNLSDEEIAAGIDRCRPTAGRNNIIKENGYTIIDDCYNANPTSVGAAVKMLSGASTRKVAILGDMYELGDDNDKLHFDTGKNVKENGIDLIICIGEYSKNTYEGAEGMERLHFDTVDEFIEKAKSDSIIRTGDAILVKASHAMHFDKIVEWLKEGK